MKLFYKTFNGAIKLVYYLLFLVGLSYLVLVATCIYIGPVNTILIKHKLTDTPVNIVVSLTTTPYRINTIKPVLDSIAKQSIKPTRVYVNIPYVFKRDKSKYIVPDWLIQEPNITINRTKDYGPATKLIATLEQENDPNTIIITIDDDKIYPKHMVRDFVSQYLFNKINSAVTIIGVNYLFDPNFNFYTESITSYGAPSLVVLGISGMMYRRDFFKQDIFELNNNLPLSCFLSDDLMISGYLHTHGINIATTFGVTYNFFTVKFLLQALSSSFTEDALGKGAKGVGEGSNEANYGNCLKLLPYYHKVKYQQAILNKSREINKLMQKNVVSNVVKKLYYKCLYFMIETIPLVKRTIFLLVSMII